MPKIRGSDYRHRLGIGRHLGPSSGRPLRYPFAARPHIVPLRGHGEPSGRSSCSIAKALPPVPAKALASDCWASQGPISPGVVLDAAYTNDKPGHIKVIGLRIGMSGELSDDAAILSLRIIYQHGLRKTLQQAFALGFSGSRVGERGHRTGARPSCISARECYPSKIMLSRTAEASCCIKVRDYRGGGLSGRRFHFGSVVPPGIHVASGNSRGAESVASPSFLIAARIERARRFARC